MLYMQRLLSGIDTSALMHQIICNRQLWNSCDARKIPGAYHQDADDILLRFPPLNSGDDLLDKVGAQIAAVNYPAWDLLPAAQPLVFGLMAQVKGVHLGRVMIAKLKPGKTIPLHSDIISEAEEKFPDRAAPARYYERYHVVLQSQPGVVFAVGEEETFMAPGEIWWIDNTMPHTVINASSDDRIHLIIDIRTANDRFVPN
jgi:hypothetical protein